MSVPDLMDRAQHASHFAPSNESFASALKNRLHEALECPFLEIMLCSLGDSVLQIIKQGLPHFHDPSFVFPHFFSSAVPLFSLNSSA